MKRYCWRESRAKFVAIVKTKMQLMLGKKHLGNEWIYRKRTFAKSRIEIEIFRKFEEATHTQKYEKTHWHWLWKRFLYLRNGGAHKNRKRLVLLNAWRVNSTLNFTRKTDRQALNFSIVSHVFIRSLDRTCYAFLFHSTCYFFAFVTFSVFILPTAWQEHL